MKALHLSDVHIDMSYQEGSLANCDQYLCCRAEYGYPTKEGDIAAGYWGAKKCDLPVHTFQSMLDYVTGNEELIPDMLFWTGDSTPHDVWMNTSQETIDHVVKAS